MSASKGLSSLLQSLLDSGITIDDGKERIIISVAHSSGRRSSRGATLFTLKTQPSSRGGNLRAGAGAGLPVTAFTPTGKVSSRKLYSIIEHFQEGISKAMLARRAGVARKKLLAAMTKLTSRGMVTERAGRYYPTVSATSGFRASRRRLHDHCAEPGCMAPHYAKGLCNNHYNSRRRQAARHGGQLESRRSNGSFKDAILSRLREEDRAYSLFELASALNEKWQSLRKDIQELVSENRLVKDGKRYLLPQS